MRLIDTRVQSEDPDRITEIDCPTGGAYRCRDDGAWTVEFIGKEAAELLRLPYSATGHSLLQCVAESDREQARKALLRSRAAGESYRFCFRLPGDGDVGDQWILDTGFWLEQPQGPLIRAGFLTDLSTCTSSPNATSATERLLLRTVGRWQDAALVVDPVRRTVLACNRAVETVFGYTPDELIGSHTRAIHLDDDTFRQFAHRIQPELEATGRSRLEFPLRRKDGTRIEADIAITAFEDRNWGSAWLGVMRDITAHKRDQEAVRELARHLQSAREQERDCIARDLHDQLGSALMLLALDCKQVKDHLDEESVEAHRHLDQMRIRIRDASDTMRRVVSYLRPPLLDRLGLAAAVESHITQLCERTGLRCRLQVTGADAAPRDPESEIAVFRIIQEALTNVVRHAAANAADVYLRYDSERWRLEVCDDGTGFQPEKVDATTAFGLRGMEERARHFQGSLEIDSRPGAGTCVRAEMPTTGAKEP